MGDRGNILVKQHNGSHVYLYTHWDGTRLPILLRKTLARKLRWNDESYLARIIFSAMIASDVEGENGYGIATSPPDNEHNFLILDCKNQKVIATKEDLAPLRDMSFKDYISLSDKEALKFRDSYEEEQD